MFLYFWTACHYITVECISIGCTGKAGTPLGLHTWIITPISKPDTLVLQTIPPRPTYGSFCFSKNFIPQGWNKGLRTCVIFHPNTTFQKDGIWPQMYEVQEMRLGELKQRKDAASQSHGLIDGAVMLLWRSEEEVPLCKSGLLHLFSHSDINSISS